MALAAEWSHWPTPAGLLGTRRVAVRPLTSLGSVQATPVAFKYPASILAASERSVLLDASGQLARVDLDAMELRWRVPVDATTSMHSAVVGGQLVSCEGRALVRRDIETGAVTGRFAARGNVVQFTDLGDRGLITVQDTAGFARAESVIALDTGARFGTVLWTRSLSFAPGHLGSVIAPPARSDAREALVLGCLAARAEVMELATGRRLREVDLGDRSHVQWRASDRTGIVLGAVTTGGPTDPLEERDPESLDVRWRIDCGRVDGLALAPDAVVCVDPHERLAAFDRASGEVRWAVELRKAEGWWPSTHLALADGVVYVASARPELRLDVYDLATGSLRGEWRLGIEADASRIGRTSPLSSHLNLVPIDRGVLLVTRVEGKGLVVVVRSPPVPGDV